MHVFVGSCVGGGGRNGVVCVCVRPQEYRVSLRLHALGVHLPRYTGHSVYVTVTVSVSVSFLIVLVFFVSALV